MKKVLLALLMCSALYAEERIALLERVGDQLVLYVNGKAAQIFDAEDFVAGGKAEKYLELRPNSGVVRYQTTVGRGTVIVPFSKCVGPVPDSGMIWYSEHRKMWYLLIGESAIPVPEVK